MQKFGGDWTETKLECIKKYLEAYVKILSKTNYKFAYIDAFAGTGYREIKDDETNNILFPELTEDEPIKFLSGSVKNALNIEIPFDQYIFIEKDKNKFIELKEISEDYPNLIDRIKVINDDANQYLSNLSRYNWSNHRAVLFLDPFGMQVKWSTLECIASTKAIDMWLLFPLGIGVSRLLKNDGNIKESMKNKLDDIFGTKDWFNKFYDISVDKTLFGQEIKTEKIVNFDAITQFLINRLKSIFFKVLEEPAKLINSKKNPLFLLCFAAGNPRGANSAVKIARDIVKRI